MYLMVLSLLSGYRAFWIVSAASTRLLTLMPDLLMYKNDFTINLLRKNFYCTFLRNNSFSDSEYNQVWIQGILDCFSSLHKVVDIDDRPFTAIPIFIFVSHYQSMAKSISQSGRKKRSWRKKSHLNGNK